MTESLTIMQEIMRSRATHNLHYGVRPPMYTSLRFNREKMRITGQNARREKMCLSAKCTGKNHR